MLFIVLMDYSIIFLFFILPINIEGMQTDKINHIKDLMQSGQNVEDKKGCRKRFGY